MWFVPRSDLQLLTPPEQMATYTFNKHVEEQKANFVKALNESLQPDAPQDDDDSPSAQRDMHQMGQGGYMAESMQQQKLK